MGISRANRPITIGVVVSFAALLGLMLVVGLTGLRAMRSLRADAQSIAETQWRDVELANEALELSNRNLQINFQIALSNDDSEVHSLITERTDNSYKISLVLNQLRARIGSKKEEECLTDLVRTRRSYLSSTQQFIDLRLMGKRREAARYLISDTLPKLYTYRAAFGDFIEFQTAEMNGQLDQGRQRFETIRFKMMLLLTLCSLLATGIAAFVVIRIGSEIDTRTLAESAVKKLNAELEEQVQARTTELRMTVQQLQEEIRNRERAQEQAQFLAYYDALTGLPNRSLLHDRMAMALSSARRRGDKVAVLYLDLDNFKGVNDTLGHAVGDLLLKAVASHVKSVLREQDTVSRLGGDEFVALLPSIAMPADAAITAARIVSAIGERSILPEYDLGITCSMGISIFPDDAKSVDDLLRHADAAMYCAKRNGRNKFQQFTDDVNTVATREWTLQNGLRHALERHELFLMYQPQLDIGRAEIVGAEALLRWKHRDLGLIPPNEFIPIAENIGIISSIGEWVLRSACMEARRWQTEGIGDVPVAVNVSPLQFRQKEFPETVKRILVEVGLDPSYLEIELTESLLLSSAEVVTTVLADLKQMGVRLSIDDFGTGYSNLSYLRNLPVYKIKIDRSFVRDIPSAEDDAAITRTIISMAKSLRLRVTAEGVETEQQLSFLRAEGCDELQGYYFSKPLLQEEFAAKMRQQAAALFESSSIRKATSGL